MTDSRAEDFLFSREHENSLLLVLILLFDAERESEEMDGHKSSDDFHCGGENGTH